MTQPEFVSHLEAVLQGARRPFGRAAVLAFVADCWPLIEDDPNPRRWAREFLESQRERVKITR
jgi:hypothetical protein